MNQPLPDALYTADQVRELDRITIEDFGTDGFELMTRAGSEAFHKMCETWPAIKDDCQQVQLFCGAGNNGGDGYIIAGLAKQKGIPVKVVALKSPDLLKGDAHKAWAFCHNLKVDIQPFSNTTSIDGDIVIDAMLGTGLSGEVGGEYRTAIENINASGKPVLAVDIPSGLCANTGAILGTAIYASQTVTFIGLKQGLMTAMGPEVCGQLTYASLNVPAEVFTRQPASCHRLSRKKLTGLIQQRPKHAHKGLYGHILLVGGNHGMPGAIIMASESALACGAGRVTVATREEHLMALAIRRPELMAQGVSHSDDLNSMISGKTIMIIGPGLGQDHWAKSLLKTALASPLPLILDADALNLIADDSQLLCDRKSPMILTPHPGEAARLLGTTADNVQKDRFNAAIEMSKRFGCTVVLKGAGSLIASGQSLQLCSAGNPGMAVAGMGDVLSGVLGALLAQGLPPEQAAALGVWLHSTAADDLAAEQGEIGMLATALIPGIRSRLNRLVNRE